jgi:hypothetical protein
VTTTEPRTPEHNPRERLSDQPLWERIRWWFWWGRGYRDLWLLAVTGLVVLALAAIQDQRLSAATQACEEAKERNVETREAINAQIAALPPGPRRERAENNRDSTFIIIDAIVPAREDCDKYASDLVGRDSWPW